MVAKVNKGFRKKRFYQAMIMASTVVMASCYSPPEFPIVPSIDFHNIEFKEVDSGLDSLIIYINFQDGDGDLGLEANETAEPYNDIYLFRKDPQDLLTYSDRFTPPFDTLPPYEWPYVCSNYAIGLNVPGFEQDTLYFQQNENHWNILIDYFVRKNGVWTEFEWETAFEPQCADGYNGRFPLLSDTRFQNPLEGTLRYGMTSAGFRFLFRNDTLKLRIKIKDRALNNSNVIETPEFVLNQIKVD